MASKYLGKIYDGLWEVVDCQPTQSKGNYSYTLENIYNHKKVIISNHTLLKVDRGETTMSSVIHTHIVNLGGGNRNTFIFSKKKIWQQ